MSYRITTSDPQILFQAGMNGQKNAHGVYCYRIPALLSTTAGTLLAVGEARVNHHYDWGNIHPLLRRSTDGGATWEAERPLLTLPTDPTPVEAGNIEAPFTIDTALVQDPTTKRIFAFFDMMPEIQGMWELNPMQSAYTEIGGVPYLNVYRVGVAEPYTVRNGIIYDPDGKETVYRVTMVETEDEAIGDVYYGSIKVGNILFTTESAGAFQIAGINYIWEIHSDDDGLTWSDPRDITPMIRAPWMEFCGIGPGNGIALASGRLVIPIYTTNWIAKTPLMGAQSAGVIYSDDHGKTWQRGRAVNDNRRVDNQVLSAATMDDAAAENSEAAAVALNNDTVKLFMRNRSGFVEVGTSYDGGATWDQGVTSLSEVSDVYVQISALHTTIDQEEFVLVANAGGPDRTNGILHGARVSADGSFEWVFHHPIQAGKYAYNSLAQIGPNRFAILYEHSSAAGNEYDILFKTIDIHKN